MIPVAVIAAILAVALVVVVRLFLRHQAALESAWADERRELLTRIQRPEMVPVPTGAPVVFPEQEDDDWGAVGTIEEDEPNQ